MIVFCARGLATLDDNFWSTLFSISFFNLYRYFIHNFPLLLTMKAFCHIFLTVRALPTHLTFFKSFKIFSIHLYTLEMNTSLAKFAALYINWGLNLLAYSTEVSTLVFIIIRVDGFSFNLLFLIFSFLSICLLLLVFHINFFLLKLLILASFFLRSMTFLLFITLTLLIFHIFKLIIFRRFLAFA